MKLAFLYAGQGSQHPGMGQDLYAQNAPFRAAFEAACADLEFDAKTLCFDGPAEMLSQTRYTQPCMVAFAAGVTAALFAENICPDAVAGLSLGEYSALQAAGVFTPRQAVQTVALRGKAMETACAGRPCGMAAVLGLERDALQAACNKADAGIVCIANYNCPGQLVIGGDAAAVEQASAFAKEAGARRCVPLQVSGAFHTPLMAPAGEALAQHFAQMPLEAPRIPVYHNATGKPMQAGDTLADLLITQVQSSVYFEDTLRNMAADGIDTIVEIGPGKVLSGFVRKTCPNMAVYAIETAEQLGDTIATLKGAKSNVNE